MAAQSDSDAQLTTRRSDQRVVLVTGGADGFGSAIVDRFCSEACRVIILDLSKEKGENKARSNPNLYFLEADVTLAETWDRALLYVKSMFGRLDVVVNNAGITFDAAVCYAAPVHTKPIKQYETIFNVNVKPIFLSAQAICPFMLTQGYGVFINISSTGCTRPRPGFAFYNASKAAVVTATRTMALEYAPTIRFNCIAPAVGNTTMLRASIGKGTTAKQRLVQLSSMLPMGRITEPRDVANAAWYLGSDQSTFVTGTVLEVDGGRGV